MDCETVIGLFLTGDFFHFDAVVDGDVEFIVSFLHLERGFGVPRHIVGGVGLDAFDGFHGLGAGFGSVANPVFGFGVEHALECEAAFGATDFVCSGQAGVREVDFLEVSA